MAKPIITLLLIICNICLAVAADGLTVLSRSGEVKFRYKNETVWKDLKTGELLESGHIIKLGLESKVSLLRESGKYITIGMPGEYKADDYISKPGSDKSSYSARFFRTVYNTITSNTDYFRDNKYSRENTVSGIVLRNFGNYLAVRSPVSSYFKDDIATFSWYSKEPGEDYTFVVKDMIEREIYSATTRDSSLTLNLAEIGLAKGKYYFWQVRCKKGKSDEYYIFRMADEKITAIADTLAFIDNELLPGNLQAAGLAKAQFLEENNLVYDSELVYRSIVNSKDCTEAHKKLFVLFLIRHNMLIEANQFLE